MEAARGLFLVPTKKFTLQQRKDYVTAYQASGKTMKRWCEENGISINSLKNWFYRQDLNKSVTKNNEVSWASVTVKEEVSMISEPVCDVRSASIRIDISGVILYVDDGTSPELLRMVLREVSRV
jgi:lambda repressor-like predicted transcriptional regulator